MFARTGVILVLFAVGGLGCNEAQNRYVAGRPTFYKPHHLATCDCVTSRSGVAPVKSAVPAPIGVIGDDSLTPSEKKAIEQHPPARPNYYREF